MTLYYYDFHGWLTPMVMPGRSTEIAPPEETETMRANWTGEAWALREYVAPPPLPAPPPPPTHAALIQQQIDDLEYEHLMPRVTRESLIAMAEERAAALGLTMEQLRAKNKGYAGLKALDEEISALRAQL